MYTILFSMASVDGWVEFSNNYNVEPHIHTHTGTKSQQLFCNWSEMN